jgi:hypothetical protein
MNLIPDESAIAHAFLLRSLERPIGSYYWQKYQYEGGRPRPSGHLSSATDGWFQWHNHRTAFGHAQSLAGTDESISSFYRIKMEDYGQRSKQFCLTSKRLCVTYQERDSVDLQAGKTEA